MDRQENTAQQQTARRQPPLLQVARQARGSLENVYLKKKKKKRRSVVFAQRTLLLPSVKHGVFLMSGKAEFRTTPFWLM